MTAVDTDIESPQRRRARRILTTIVIIACMGLLVVAAQHTQRGDKDEPKFTGDTASGSTSVVELEAPTPESSVLSQAQITLDLNINYDATLQVNGVEIPTAQLQKRPELAQVSFTPGTGKVFEKLPQGRVCVTGNVFRIDGTQEDPRTVSWCFNVT